MSLTVFDDLQLKCENSNKFREEICNQWKFNEYCPAQNSFISNVKNQSKVAQTIRSKSVKNYYNDDYAYLLIDIHMNRTDHVSLSNLFYCIFKS